MDDIKLTKDFCQGKDLIFHPESKNEANFILKNLFAMGFRWSNSGTQNLEPEEIDNAVRHKIILKKNGGVYTAPSQQFFGDKKITNKALLCSSTQFSPPFNAKNAEYQSDREILLTLLEKFNSISIRLDRLTTQVEKISAEIAPIHLNKDGFKPK